MSQKHESPSGSNGRAIGETDLSQCEQLILLHFPETVNFALKRRNDLAARDRQTPEYQARNNCYDPIEAVMNALRNGTELSERRLRELGVTSLADFVWRLRPSFRRLMEIYRVKRFRDLIPLHGKETGCWQFDHIKPLSEIDPDDVEQFLRYCNVSNIEPVTWWENTQRRDAAKRGPFQDLLGLFNGEEHSCN